MPKPAFPPRAVLLLDRVELFLKPEKSLWIKSESFRGEMELYEAFRYPSFLRPKIEESKLGSSEAMMIYVTHEILIYFKN